MRKNSIVLVGSTVLVGLALASCSKKAAPPGAPGSAPQASASAAAPDTKAEVERARIAVGQAPNYANFLALGLAQMNDEQNEAAAQSFEQAIRLDPKNAYGYNNLCFAYNKLSRWKAAIDACQRAISLAPDMQIARNNLAWSQDRQKEAQDRISALDAKTRAEPADHALVMQLGFEHYNLGDYSAAIAVWRRIPKGSPLWGSAQNNVASAGILSKDWGSAKQGIENALSVEPTNQLYLNNWAWYQRAAKEAGVLR
jgi:Flp pilus assembly protein TadD